MAGRSRWSLLRRLRATPSLPSWPARAARPWPATFGAWAGLTIWEGPTLLGLGLLMTTRKLRADGWAVLAAMIFMLVYLLFAPPGWNGLVQRPGHGVILLTWLLHVVILVYKHRADLVHPPILRSRSSESNEL